MISENNSLTAVENRFKTSTNISQYVEKEFAEVHDSIRPILNMSMDLSQIRNRVSDEIPKRVISSCRRLLDTLINDLMKDSLEILEPAPSKIKNEFYALDLRSKLGEVSSINLEEAALDFHDPTPMYKKARVAIPPIGLCAWLLPWGTTYKIVAGLAFMASTASFFHTQALKSEIASKQKLEGLIKEYIETSKNQTEKWLINDIKQQFISDFVSFCNDANYDI